MTGRARQDKAKENGPKIPDATSRVARREPEPSPDTPLKSYLSKLLDLTAEAPPEPMPRSAVEESVAVTAEPQPCAATHPRRYNTAESERESRPRWQTADDTPPETRARTGAMPRTTLRCRLPRKRAAGDRQKLMMALIPVLAIVLIAVWRNPLSTRPALKAAGASPRTFDRPMVPAVEIPWAIPGRFELEGRDPMQWPPPSAGVQNDEPPAVADTPENSGELVVTGILYSEDRPSAIVNTQLVHEGQQISGATVDKIESDGVQFERNGRKWKQGVNQ